MCNKNQPGVMLYFDLRLSLQRLSCEEKGILFDAILDYGQDGTVPELEGVLGVAWDFIRPRLDLDRRHYQDVVEQRRAAARKRWDREDDANACK